MVEFSLDQNLQDMVNAVKGKPDRFIHLEVKFSKKKEPKIFEFSGNSEGLVDKLTELVKRGNVRVITQAIGTYTGGTTPRDNYIRKIK